MKLTIAKVLELLAVMQENNADAEVDWTNRQIMVLSEEITNPNVQLSDGPMTYRDYLFCLREEI